MNYNKFFTILVISTLFSQGISAQLNFETGYAFSYVLNAPVNSDIEIFNSAHPEFTKKLKPLSNFSGIQFALRYRFEPVAVKLLGQLNFQSTSASNEENKQKLNYRYSYYGAGLEFFTGPASLGANLLYNNFQIRNNLDGESLGNILNQNFLSLQAYLAINTENDGVVNLSIRPFINIPFSSINLASFKAALNSEVNPVASADKIWTIGVQLILLNGPSY